MKVALFIGRFQPFHSGHLSVLQNIHAQGYNQVIIGVGSSQYSRTINNPLTYDERKHIIDLATKDASNIPNIDIIALPDIHNDAQWVMHVDLLLAQKNLQYDSVFSGNELVTALFKAAGKKILPVKRTIHIDGTAIRQYIKNNDERWKQFVHPTTYPVVQTIRDILKS